MRRGRRHLALRGPLGVAPEIGPNASSVQIWNPFPFEMKNEAMSADSRATNTARLSAADS